MRTDQGQPTLLSEYRPPDYLVDTVTLDIVLHQTATRVRSRLSLRPNPQGRAGAALVLQGDGLVARRVTLDGVEVDLASGLVTPERLTIEAPPPGPFQLEIETLLDPTANTRLMGLYRTGSAYCTQCEAEGFRRITYALDRPDVLSVFTTRIEADKDDAPVLLGNGNLVEEGDGPEGGRHYAIWHDPFPKPSYLFALVGGTLDCLRDSFTTASGRAVALGIHVEPGKVPLAGFAMDALKRSMRWDEKAFGREYDLDVFNIVAVSDFNMGAMENKGLNVFNDKYILASPETATDADYAGIETVIAHEYFHNWTGNRITCRDWFQLCLKEGLTVYRDQEFSSDERSRPVKRIADVRTLRLRQFPEDAGPLAHDVRPDRYLEINNFYTATIYEKGAEIIRMLRLIVGSEPFAQGMTRYFERYDGTAATVEDFIGCFAEVSGRDLKPFLRWYEQAGTPELRMQSRFEVEGGRLQLELSQRTSATPGQPEKTALVIPVAFGLIGANGAPVGLAALQVEGASDVEIRSGVIELASASRRITFSGLAERAVPSLLRGFSAPVKLVSDLSDADLALLLAHDSDSFNRWQSAQTLATRALIAMTVQARTGAAPVPASPDLVRALGALLADDAADPALVAQTILLPSEADICRDLAENVDPDAVHAAREALRAAIGSELAGALRHHYKRLADPGPYSPAASDAGRRALRNAALWLLAGGDADTGAALAAEQFEAATNMTDRLAALGVASLVPGEAREHLLARFHSMFEADPLVGDKWFALQAAIPERGTLDRVRGLMTHPGFSMATPNRVYALIGGFGANPTQFNRADGLGYEFIAETVLALDAKNPQVAARMLNAFRSWRTMGTRRQEKASAALHRIALQANLSPDVRDVVDRSLGG